MIKKIKNKIKNSFQSSVKEEVNDLMSLTKENYWANVFNSSIQGSEWMKNIPLNVGRWAANYSLLYVLFRILNEIKPLNILELGLGETTKILQAYKKFHCQNAYSATVEHDSDWVTLKRANGISPEYIDIIQCEIEEVDINGYRSLGYKDLTEKLGELNKKFDLLLIDGPFGSDNYSRFNIIDLVKKRLLAKSFIIIIDDYHRQGEQQTFDTLQKTLKEENIEFRTGFYSGDKRQAIACSPDYSYITTL